MALVVRRRVSCFAEQLDLFPSVKLKNIEQQPRIHSLVVVVHRHLFLKSRHDSPEKERLIPSFFLLLLQAPQTKEELLRELQVRRAADEAAAAAKKKAEEQRVSVRVIRARSIDLCLD